MRSKTDFSLSAILRLAGALFFMMPVIVFGQGKDPYEHFFHQTLNDFSEELQIAKEEGKKGIFLFFEMDECPFCHYMKNNILNRSDVQEYYRKHFKCFPVDIEGDIEVTTFDGKVMKQKDFAFKINRVRATPVMAFYDLNGKQVVKFIGKTTDASEFLLLGQYYLDGAYRDMPFTKYKRQQRKKN